MQIVVRKSAGPYIGPRGGKWADPQHKIPWKEDGDVAAGSMQIDADGAAEAWIDGVFPGASLKDVAAAAGLDIGEGAIVKMRRGTDGTLVVTARFASMGKGPNDPWEIKARRGKVRARHKNGVVQILERQSDGEFKQIGSARLDDGEFLEDVKGAVDQQTISSIEGRILHAFGDNAIHENVRRYFSKSGKSIKNETVAIPAEYQGKGLGTRILKAQVVAAKKLGVERLNTLAFGSPTSDYSGYYVWPLLGYNATLGADHKTALRAAGFSPAPFDTHELFQMKGGAAWWKANGASVHASLDLTEKSAGLRVLDAYLKAKSMRKAEAAPEVDEALLIRLWERRGLHKSAGPFIGPRGGKWADPQHTIPWDDASGKPLSSKVQDALITTVNAVGSLDVTIKKFARAGDRSMHVGGEKVPASRLAAALQSWKPKPLPAGAKLVTVHHSTTRAIADRILKDGVIKELKPWTLAARRHAAGEAATFAPGAGVERGLYVGAPGTTDGFGPVTLEIQVPAAWLKVPAELTALGHKDDTTAAAKTEHGALVRQSIPASAVREVGLHKSAGPYIGPRGGKWADPQHTVPWGEAVATTHIADTPKGYSVKLRLGGALAGSLWAERIGDKLVAGSGAKASDVFVGWVSIHTEHRGKGHGEVMYRAAMQEAKKRGVKLRTAAAAGHTVEPAAKRIWARLHKSAGADRAIFVPRSSKPPSTDDGGRAGVDVMRAAQGKGRPVIPHGADYKHKLQAKRQWNGINVSVENKRGTYRSGIDKDGQPWRIKMTHDYGRIPRTCGADGDAVDVFVGPIPDGDEVWVIRQVDPVSGKYDEDKVMMGFENEAAAKRAYLANFDSPRYFGGITPIGMGDFRSWIKDRTRHGKRISKSEAQRG